MTAWKKWRNIHSKKLYVFDDNNVEAQSNAEDKDKKKWHGISLDSEKRTKKAVEEGTKEIKKSVKSTVEEMTPKINSSFELKIKEMGSSFSSELRELREIQSRILNAIEFQRKSNEALAYEEQGSE